MGEGVLWLFIFFVAMIFITMGVDDHEKAQDEIAILTAELCVATEGADFFMCHAKCHELNERQGRICIDKYAELIANDGSNQTRP